MKLGLKIVLIHISQEFANGPVWFNYMAAKGRGIFPYIMAKYGYSKTLLTL